MIWIWLLLLLVFLCLAGLVFATAYFFRDAFMRKESPDLTTAENVKGTHLEPFLARFQESRAWFDSQAWEEVCIMSGDGLKLAGRILPAENPKGTILLMHGYHSSALNDFSCVVPFYQKLGYRVLLADQRAHGKSEGRYITFGVLERMDCKRWAEYIRERFGPENPIFLNGISMGCATVLMASGLALPDNVKGIIADCGFTSPYEIVKTVMVRDLHFPPHFPVLYTIDIACRLFAHFRLKEYSTLEAMQTNKIPIFFVHGDKDRFVPLEMTYENYEACRAEKELLVVKNAGHAICYLVSQTECEQALAGFLEKMRTR